MTAQECSPHNQSDTRKCQPYAVASLKAVEQAHVNVSNAKAALETALGLDTPTGAPIAAAAAGISVEDWLRGISSEDSQRDGFDANPVFVDYDDPPAAAPNASDDKEGKEGEQGGSSQGGSSTSVAAGTDDHHPTTGESPSSADDATISDGSASSSTSPSASSSSSSYPKAHPTINATAVIAIAGSKMDELSDQKAKVDSDFSAALSQAINEVGLHNTRRVVRDACLTARAHLFPCYIW
jgi:hypothetical protein